MCVEDAQRTPPRGPTTGAEGLTNMESGWYYADAAAKTPHGPFSVNDLGKLSAASCVTGSTLVWKDGMKDWSPLSSMRSLYAHAVLGHGVAPNPCGDVVHSTGELLVLVHVVEVKALLVTAARETTKRGTSLHFY